MGKLKILFLIDGLQTGGAEKSLLELCKRFQRIIPVIVVLSDSLELKPEFLKIGIHVFECLLPRNYRFARNAKALIPLLEEIKPDVIHSFLFHADMTLRYLNFEGPKITGLVSNSYSHRRVDQLPWEIALKVKILKIWDRLTSSKIDFFIANSQIIKDAYVKDLSIKKEKIKVIHRGRDISKFQRKSKLFENERQRNFISVGRLIESKGYSDLIRSFSLLERENKKVSLTICGEGPGRLRLGDLIKELDLSTKVRLVGLVNDIPKKLQDSDYFIFPTYYEGLPGSIIEAMLSGIPIICSDIPENRECIKDGMGLFHKVGDQTDLYSKMKEAIVLDDWDIRTQKAYAYAVEHFEIGKIVEQYEETYLKLLSK